MKPNDKRITLHDLELRRQKVLAEIRLQQQKMGKTCGDTFRPVKTAATFTDNFAHTIKSIVSLYQGALWGLKIVRFFGEGKYKKKV